MKKIQLLYVLASTLLFAACGNGNTAGDLSLIPVVVGNDYGYINPKGEFVINPQFSTATLFRDGMALVSASGNTNGWGYIDEKGKYVITPSFKSATVFSEGIAFVVSENEAPKAIDEKGNTKFTLQNAEAVRPFREGLAAFCATSDDGITKWGFIDKAGKVKINPQFSSVGNFSNGKCRVSNDNQKFGYIDKDGKLIINNQFDGAGDFNNGRSVVYVGSKIGVIDANGKYLINPQFAGIIPDNDKYVIRIGNKVGWADKEGKIIINPQFDDALPFYDNNLAPVSENGSWGYISKEGKFKINPQFDVALPFNGSMALVKSGNKYGFIDKEGKYIVNPQFDGISNDLLEYLNSKNSSQNAMYSYVKSEFYNIGAITAKVKTDITNDGVRGVSLTAPVSVVMAKFRKQPGDFYQYATQTKLVNNEKIGQLASLNISMLGTPYVDQQNGYYSSKVFNDQAVPQGYLYTITPLGKGYNKVADIMNTIEKDVFNGYTKDDASTALQRTYTSPAQKIIMQQYGNTINIYVMPPTYMAQ